MKQPKYTNSLSKIWVRAAAVSYAQDIQGVVHLKLGNLFVHVWRPEWHQLVCGKLIETLVTEF